jgi:ubiquitin C-terminal hydrolase
MCDSCFVPGHYTSYNLRGGSWFRMNDSKTTAKTIEDVQREVAQDAYILMYAEDSSGQEKKVK